MIEYIGEGGAIANEIVGDSFAREEVCSALESDVKNLIFDIGLNGSKG